jgi:hypothetical protein
VPLRDSYGRFQKGGIRPKEWYPSKETSIKNLGMWIGRVPPMSGKRHSEKAKQKMVEACKLRISRMSEEERKKRYGVWKNIFGEKHPQWKKNKKIKDKRDDNHPAYKAWVREIKRRDVICKLKDDSCSGNREVHHIKSWSNYPELRYDINNGITLCHAHHPRSRAKEKELEARFETLIKTGGLQFL